jgi:hypothetical protein
MLTVVELSDLMSTTALGAWVTDSSNRAVSTKLNIAPQKPFRERPAGNPVHPKTATVWVFISRATAQTRRQRQKAVD